MSRSILKDIDIETLYAMRRDEELNNAEIADRIGVSTQTVYRYIGKQPAELKRKPIRRENQVRHHEPEIHNACLVVKSKTISLTGIYAQYTLDMGGDRIEIVNAHGENMSVTKDMLGDFINELSAIKRKLEVATFENEAW